MATYTEHYGLHQWEPTDDFLRTDFNTDFGKIDAALGAKAEQSQVDTLSALVKEKCRVMVGQFTGNGTTQTISLGVKPKVVIVSKGATSSDLYMSMVEGGSGAVAIQESGFSVTYYYSSSLNEEGDTYGYLALV